MAKASKQEAHYRDYPNGKERCHVCDMFRPPQSCTAVAGAISDRGWCRYFERKKGRDARWYGEAEDNAIPVTGLAQAVDRAHREHAGRAHPDYLTYQGRTYKLGD